MIADHATLLDLLSGPATCQVMVSGHPSALYDEMLSDWRRVALQVDELQAQVRTEVVWFKLHARADALGQPCRPERHRPSAHQAARF